MKLMILIVFCLFCCGCFRATTSAGNNLQALQTMCYWYVDSDVCPKDGSHANSTKAGRWAMIPKDIRKNLCFYGQQACYDVIDMYPHLTSATCGGKKCMPEGLTFKVMGN